MGISTDSSKLTVVIHRVIHGLVYANRGYPWGCPQKNLNSLIRRANQQYRNYIECLNLNIIHYIRYNVSGISLAPKNEIGLELSSLYKHINALITF